MSANVEIQHAELQHRIDELSGTVEQLRRELAQLRERDATQETGSRRQLLKVVGGVAAGVLVGSNAQPSPAHAATGDVVFAGWSVGATNITRIRNGTFAPSIGTPLTSEATMFWVDNRLSTLPNAHGLRADGKGSNGIGLWGNSDSGGIGVYGGGSPGVWAEGTIGLKASGTAASAILVGSNAAPPARLDAHSRGEIDIDVNGDVWLCTATGTPGTWRKLAGPTTAGAFHPISPARVYDSRFAGGTRIAAGQNRLVSVADGHDPTTGLLDAPNVVPAGATAIAFNLTITGTIFQGFLTVAPGTATAITASSINWKSDNADIANGLIVQLDSNRQVRVFCGGGSTDFLIDVSGYYL